MTDSSFQHIRIDRRGPVTWVWLARPEVHNAFGAQLIAETDEAFRALSHDDSTRVVVFAGKGRNFSAGADINWMRDSVTFSHEQNVEDATRLSLMLEAIATCEKPVVCRVQGMALGGALGLMAAADYVIAAERAKFAFSEVKLGIVPAVISPFVLDRIGAGQARPLFMTGERFDAARALRIGLAHVVVADDELDAEVDRIVGELLTAAPRAITVAGQLAAEVPGMSREDARRHTAHTIATKRTDAEGQEGLGAFLEKRRPAWMDESRSPAWLRS